MDPQKYSSSAAGYDAIPTLAAKVIQGTANFEQMW